MITRRHFLRGAAGGAMALGFQSSELWAAPAAPLAEPVAGEDIFRFIIRQRGRHDPGLLAAILGAANEFKEGDEILGVAAVDPISRRRARRLLANTRISDLDSHALHQDGLYRFVRPLRRPGGNANPQQTFAQLKQFLLDAEEETIKSLMPAWSSDVIGCVVKLMSNEELIRVGAKVFNPLPNSRIGAKGYLGARIQPNSPTDNVDDIRWQVLNGWSYAVGDVLLGTNPVSSTPESVVAIERTLQDLLTTFGIKELMPHCVLAHIDVQAEVERRWPGATELWFQSIAGADTANETFDISVEKMKEYAASRNGRFGLYFETGQGADFTNGHGHGFDMVLHESRKYGFARSLSREVAAARRAAGDESGPWVHLNDVAGFIGPEVFRSREQLVRCCLEDIVMGKLHGLCLGLDVCSTLHMDISLDDLDWCLEQIMPANPAYLMALPTKIDPMLGYLTTGYQDHVRLRETFGYRVNDPMWDFFKKLGVIDAQGRPTERFGDPLWVYLQYRRRKGDMRDEGTIRDEGRQAIGDVRRRGLFIAEGHGERVWDLPPKLRSGIDHIYDDAKLSIWAEWDLDFLPTVPNGLTLATNSQDREDYILHPATGETPNVSSANRLERLRRDQDGRCDVQIVISDGLNALALMETGHLQPFLKRLRERLAANGRRPAETHLVFRSGRVRAGYRAGEILFGGLSGRRAILHIIGERPGTGHRTFSTYITAPDGEVWSVDGKVDHNITKVVSGIATTAMDPIDGADQVARLLESIWKASD